MRQEIWNQIYDLSWKKLRTYLRVRAVVVDKSCQTIGLQQLLDFNGCIRD